MKRNCILLAIAAWLAIGAVGSALDIINPVNKKTKQLRGHVVRMTPQEVEIEVGNSGVSKVMKVNEIESISFEDEPAHLTEARSNINKGEYDKAKGELESLTADGGKRPEIAADIEFYKAFCAARDALGGNGEVADAGRDMAAFAKKYPNNFHYLEACEMLGNLLVANRNYAQAETYYAELANTPFADYKMRAGIGMGKALLAQGKHADAMRAFDDVLNGESMSEQAESQRLAAKLGKARCLALANKPQEAIKMAEEIIAKAKSDESDLLGEAYNTLGTSLRKAGKPKEALLAFLHVDVLYNSMPDAHAEALANLAELFQQMHKADHATVCLQTLKKDYPNSPWAAGK